jgi:type III secretory pathway component EscT
VQGVSVLLAALGEMGLDLMAFALAWARLLPTLVLVPAFGAKVLPRATVTVLGLGLGFALSPALAGALTPQAQAGPFVLALVYQVAAGLPVALSSAALLWAAMMAGGVIDDVRGVQSAAASPFAEVSTPIGTLFGLYACFSFLQLGGAEHVVSALLDVEPSAAGLAPQLLRAVGHLVAAIGIALALATPILVAVIVWEVAAALIARAATPAHVQAVVAPIRSLVLLSALALSLEGIFALMQRVVIG